MRHVEEEHVASGKGGLKASYVCEQQHDDVTPGDTRTFRRPEGARPAAASASAGCCGICQPLSCRGLARSITLCGGLCEAVAVVRLG
eukprot:scaffold134_cov29-Tisochrysis_lutea.AAC.1